MMIIIINNDDDKAEADADADADADDEFTWPRDLGSVAEFRCDGGNIVLNWYSYSGSEKSLIIHTRALKNY